METAKRSRRLPATIMFDPHIRRTLKLVAVGRDTSVSELVNQACRTWIETQPITWTDPKPPKPAA